MTKISSNAFKEYIFDEANFDFEFSSLEEIEQDAFNGIIIYDNAQLNIVINGLDNDQNLKQSDKITINRFAFRGISLNPGAKLNINIINYKIVEFNEDSLNGFRLLRRANVNISLENNENVFFRQKCAYNWDEDAHVDYFPEIMVNSVQGELFIVQQNDEQQNKTKNFQINLNNIKKIMFEKDSFNGIKQGANSIFQILASNFELAELYDRSFSSIDQGISSKFELNLFNGKFIKLSEGIFEDIQQGISSQFIILFDSISNSLCIPKHTIKNFKQNKNSSLKFSFISNRYNLYVDSHAFVELKQDEDSYIEIYGNNYYNVYFKAYALESLTQLSSSFFELLFSQTVNLILESNTFSKFRQVNGSRIRIGYISSTGTFQQSPFVFDKLEQEAESNFVYDFTPGSNFNLKFPPRQSPRMLVEAEPSGLNSNIQLLNSLYPNFGKSNRPNRINLLEYVIQSEDFCKVADLPSDLILQLAPKTPCTCPVYYLYRMLRGSKPANDSWLSYVPQCYQRSIIDKEDLDQIELNCEFERLINDCREDKLSQKFKLKKNFECSVYTPENDDYLTIEILNDKNVNILESTKVDDVVIESKSMFGNMNKTTMITIISIVILVFFFTVVVVVVVLFRMRNNKGKNRLKADFSSDSDSDNDLNKGKDATTSNGDPIYKKNKIKTPSVDSRNYLIDSGNQQSNEIERCNLVVSVDCANIKPKSDLVGDNLISNRDILSNV